MASVLRESLGVLEALVASYGDRVPVGTSACQQLALDRVRSRRLTQRELSGRRGLNLPGPCPRSRPSRRSRRQSQRRPQSVSRLGVRGQLRRTLASTNPCESMIECVRRNERQRKALVLGRDGPALDGRRDARDHRRCPRGPPRAEAPVRDGLRAAGAVIGPVVSSRSSRRASTPSSQRLRCDGTSPNNEGEMTSW